MRLFLSEYLCSGALAGRLLPDSLAREGRAMRDVLAEDFSGLPGVEVELTSDRRIPPPPAGRVTYVDTAAEEWMRFEDLCRSSDATCVIAPELEGILIDRCRVAAALSPRLLNAEPNSVELCSDKLRLAERLQAAGVRTVSTELVRTEADALGIGMEWLAKGGGCVLKPRYGAGSQFLRHCTSLSELREALGGLGVVRGRSEFLLQPFHPGRPLSVAGLFDPSEPDGLDLWPLAEQCLSGDRRFEYLGGRLPVPSVHEEMLRPFIAAVAACVPGLRGYIGFDLIEDAEGWTLVEINPRLTTSYVGYRQATEANLAAGMLFPRGTVPPRWRAGVVTYQPGGETRIDSSLMPG